MMTNIGFWGVTAAAAMLLAGQDVPPPEPPPAAAAAVPAETPVAEGFVRVPANTALNFQILEALDSKSSKIDSMFSFRISDAVTIDGKTVIPAGAVGQGQVVHAARARAMGKAGELILAARYVDCGDVRVPLRGFRMGRTGTDRSGQAFAASMFVPLAGFFIAGGESTVPVGASANARLSAATDLRVAPATGCPVAIAAAPAEPTPPAQFPPAQSKVQQR